MSPTSGVTEPIGASAARRPWPDTLRALREARGVTQEGWAARLGVSRKTVQRWEGGARAPDPGAEAAIVAYCRHAGLLRAFDRGPLTGLTLTEAGLQDLFAEARRRGGRAPPAPAAPERAAAVAPRPPRPAGAPAAAGAGASEGAATGPAFAGGAHLPLALTSFVGRERELAAARRVQAGARLLTLTGTGGAGKTRLALALAGELAGSYPHGVWLAALAPLADGALLPAAVAGALGVATGQGAPLAALVDALRGRRLLLVLDNCEHLLDACAALTETLLAACPGLDVLATSRESLRVDGETIWRVPPMAVPAAAPAAAPGAAARGATDSERLFVERARLQRPELVLTPDESAAVAEICRRLDGMPLAIELAAARTGCLAIGQIAARLDDRFRLLAGGPGGARSAASRHQTLRAAMDWSYDLLSPPERATLRALSVFAGGFTLEAAETVCAGCTGDGAAGVLDLIDRLVDTSLVVADLPAAADGAVRYRLLETVRQYAAGHLEAAGEAPAARARHAGWCLALAEAAAPHRAGPEQAVWLQRLTLEHDNVRAALGWCLTASTGERGATAGLRLGAVLGWLWQVRGLHGEGRRWLAALLERGAGARPELRAEVLSQAGWLARDQGDLDESLRLHRRSLTLGRKAGDTAVVARSLNDLGVLTDVRGDPARARTLFTESLALYRSLGNRPAAAGSLNNLGVLARKQGDTAAAIALFEECLAVFQEVGDTRGVANALLNLGHAQRDQQAFDPAGRRYRESLAGYAALGDRPGAVRCLEGLAAVATAGGDARRAARLCGAAAAQRLAIGVPVPPSARANLERTTAGARAALGETAFAAAWAAGEALTPDAATAEALAAPPPV